MLRVNLIGAGRVGQTLAHLWVQAGVACMGGVVTRSLSSAERAIEFIGQGQYCAAVDDLPAADFTLIATPDDAIATVSLQLANNSALRPGDLVAHCSGRYSADCLVAVKARGCWIASAHPLRSIAEPALSVIDYAGTFCALEGDAQAIQVLSTLCTAIGAKPFLLAKQHKALYHAACVFASNYLVTLAEQARVCLHQAGVDPHLIKPLILSLMQGSLHNLARVDEPAQALTGPLQRGDAATVDAHVQALSPVQRACYMALAQATIPLVSST